MNKLKFENDIAITPIGKYILYQQPHTESDWWWEFIATGKDNGYDDVCDTKKLAIEGCQEDYKEKITEIKNTWLSLFPQDKVKIEREPKMEEIQTISYKHSDNELSDCLENAIDNILSASEKTIENLIKAMAFVDSFNEMPFEEFLKLYEKHHNIDYTSHGAEDREGLVKQWKRTGLLNEDFIKDIEL